MFSNLHGFRNGLLTGILAFAALNAISYFYWSPDGGNILGLRSDRRESLGFPLVVWDYDGRTQWGTLHSRALLIDVLIALGISTVAGMWVSALTKPTATSDRPIQSPFRFGLQTVFGIMSAVAIFAALGRRGFVSPAYVLAGIYAGGPLLLLLIGSCTPMFSSGARVLLLATLTGLLIASVIIVGPRVDAGRDFTRALLRMFVCWTPQLVLLSWLVSIGTSKPSSSSHPT